jgi:cytochrome P450
MGWTVWLLGHHPTVQDRIVDELYSIFGRCTISSIRRVTDAIGDDVDRSITVDDLTQMKYLERCIKESLRLFPPVPLFARLLTEDMQVGENVQNENRSNLTMHIISDGYTIPKGVTVVVSPPIVQRDPDVIIGCI